MCLGSCRFTSLSSTSSPSPSSSSARRRVTIRSYCSLYRVLCVKESSLRRPSPFHAAGCVWGRLGWGGSFPSSTRRLLRVRTTKSSPQASVSPPSLPDGRTLIYYHGQPPVECLTALMSGRIQHQQKQTQKQQKQKKRHQQHPRRRPVLSLRVGDETDCRRRRRGSWPSSPPSPPQQLYPHPHLRRERHRASS